MLKYFCAICVSLPRINDFAKVTKCCKTSTYAIEVAIISHVRPILSNIYEFCASKIFAPTVITRVCAYIDSIAVSYTHLDVYKRQTELSVRISCDSFKLQISWLQTKLC